jgi:two-component system sensor histidine kinase/response regulator
MQGGGMKSVLVIDDNRDVRTVVHDTLVHLSGYSVRQAKDGREGVQMVIARRPDLILCDVNMPGLDGYHTLEAIRACPGTASIPFILMTGAMDAKDFRRGMASGADDYIMKPFTPAELDAAVRSRFAREEQLQADITKRVESIHREEIRRFSEELAAPINGMLSAVAAKLHQEPPTANQAERVYYLD